MKKRFLKSQFDVIRFIAFDAAALVFSLWLMMGNSQELLQLPYFVIIWCVVLFLCQLAFILMAAHTVVIDEQGITRYFFKKQLEHIPWWEILSVRKAYHNRSTCYEFTQDRIAPGFVDVKACLRLDYRKAIKRAVLAYAPPHIKKQMEGLK